MSLAAKEVYQELRSKVMSDSRESLFSYGDIAQNEGAFALDCRNERRRGCASEPVWAAEGSRLTKFDIIYAGWDVSAPFWCVCDLTPGEVGRAGERAWMVRAE